MIMTDRGAWHKDCTVNSEKRSPANNGQLSDGLSLSSGACLVNIFSPCDWCFCSIFSLVNYQQFG
jgi:hypothetical protein